MILVWNFDKETPIEKRKRIESKATHKAKESEEEKDSEDSPDSQNEDGQTEQKKSLTQLKIEQQFRSTKNKNDDKVKVAKDKWSTVAKGAIKSLDKVEEKEEMDTEGNQEGGQSRKKLKSNNDLIDPNNS
jgi:hypothetical protein